MNETNKISNDCHLESRYIYLNILSGSKQVILIFEKTEVGKSASGTYFLWSVLKVSDNASFTHAMATP